MKTTPLPPFKADWEKTNSHFKISDALIYKIVKSSLPEVQLESHEIIEGGCANLNIKLNLNDGHIKLLRIYIRDHEAAYREQAISQLIQHAVPVPSIKTIDQMDGHCFVISEFKSGITLRDLLLSNQVYSLKDIMCQVGELLSRLAKFTFSSPGFFDRKLNVTELLTNHECIASSKNCLKKKAALNALSPELIASIDQTLDQCSYLLDQAEGNQLVHADFDPANILVIQTNGHWTVSAILDWEFAFSGSVLWDVASMLRYAHRMPEAFETSFIHSLTSNGVNLPSNWKVIIQFLNMISLLDCLNRTDINISPLQSADISSLLQGIVLSLDEAQ